MNIIVTVANRIVNVDNQQYECLGKTPPGVVAIRWYERYPTPGQFELVGGEIKPFSEFSIIQPYYDQWLAAKKDAEAKQAAERAAERKKIEDRIKAQNDAFEEARKQFEAQIERDRALNAALSELGSYDHEVIKAMEAKLATEGLLPAGLVSRRQALRETVKAERKKSG